MSFAFVFKCTYTAGDEQEPILEFRTHGFLKEKKPVFVATQLFRFGGEEQEEQTRLADDDVVWASIVDRIVDDGESISPFGLFSQVEDDLKDMTWFECHPGDAPDGDKDTFTSITFNIFEPDSSVERYGEKLTNPQRKPVTRAEVEACIGEEWSAVRNLDSSANKKIGVGDRSISSEVVMYYNGS